jgi:hypothetical protein
LLSPGTIGAFSFSGAANFWEPPIHFRCFFALLKSCAKHHASPVQDSSALWMLFIVAWHQERFAVLYPLNPQFDLSCVHSATASAPS